jgi:tetratricopeptide (TPR) repeat protein
MPTLPRPAWAHRLDRITLRLLRGLHHVLPRPSESALHQLARDGRPAPPRPLPDLGALGLIDTLTLGRDAIRAGQPAEALVHFGQLLADEPDHAWALHGRADAFQLLGDPEAALLSYERACILSPREALHQAGRANALEALGRQGEARQARDKARSLDPKVAWVWTARDPTG